MIYVTNTGVAVPEACVSMPAPTAPITLPALPEWQPITIDGEPVHPWKLIQ